MEKILAELQTHELFLDSQDVDFLMNLAEIVPTDITGAVAMPVKDISDCTVDYDDIWFTESVRPFDLMAVYHPASYYRDEP